jgi:hypothetical protein
MAIPFTVPRRYQSGLAKISRLDDESTHELWTALQQTPSSTDSDTLVSAVAAAVDTIAVSDLEEIVPALLHYYAFRDATQSSASEVAEGIAHEMEEIPSTSLRLSPKDSETLQARLLELLSIDSLYAIARAARLSLENEHSFTEARVVTDIRPVFDQERPEAPPTGAIVVHTLRITYVSDNNEIKNFFVALDTNEVRELLKHLERADLKAESIKKILDATEMDYIDGG